VRTRVIVYYSPSHPHPHRTPHPPSSTLNTKTFMNHSVPYPDRDLRNLESNSTFYYPLLIQQSPIEINVTVYVGGKAGILEESMNNANFVKVKTPSTESMTIFEPTPVI